MRADFFGKCAAIPGLARRMAERDVLVPPMTETELRESIEKPADLVGLEFEKGLVRTILEEVGDEPGSLPLLQHTLLELYDGRSGRWLTTDRYDAIGRVKHAIASRAESIYSAMSPEEQTAARRVLLRLTQPGSGTEDTRRRAALSELVGSGTAGEAAEDVIEKLAGARLLTTDEGEGGEVVVDVAHEALIRGWPRLQEWVDENPSALRIHRELTDKAEEWEKHGRKGGYLLTGPHLDEAKAFEARNRDDLNDLERAYLKASKGARQRRLLLGVGGLAAASVVFAGLGIFTLFQGEQARQAVGEARANALLSDSIVIAAESPPLGQRLAVEALVRGEELGLDLKQLVNNASLLVGTGRYMHLPRPIDIGWTDPGGRVLVGSRTGAPGAIFDTGDGHQIGKLGKDLSDAQFSQNPNADVFVAAYDSGQMELRQISDAGLIKTPATIGAVAISPDPEARAMVVGYGTPTDGEVVTAPTNGPPAEIRSVIDGNVLTTLRPAAGVELLEPPEAGLALVSYDDGGVELVDLADGSSVLSLDAKAGSVDHSPTGHGFLVHGDDGCELISVTAGASTDLAGDCTTARFSDDGRTLETFGDTSVDFISVDALKPMLQLDDPSWALLAASPETPPRFVVVSNKNKTRLYATSDQREVTHFEDTYSVGDQDGGPTETFSPDGSLAYLPMAESTALVSTSTGEVFVAGKAAVESEDAFVPRRA